MTDPLLSRKKCLPCSGYTSPLSTEEVAKLLPQISTWTCENNHLKKTFRFKNFAKLMEFVNKMAELAEAEGHHPNFYVNYNVLDVEIWTHAINGLSESDFILAAKIDGLSH